MNILYEDAYRLLAACFYPPTAALYEEHCCSHLADLLAAISPEAQEHSRHAAGLLQQHSPEEHLVEYSRLFLGPFKLVAPPYGSVWLEQSQAVMGESTARVADYYQSQGLRLADDFPELPDHITVELEFLSYLCFKQRDAEQHGDAAALSFHVPRLEFITTFLYPWLPKFCTAITDDGSSPFYAALARCTHAVVTADLAKLTELSPA